MFSANENGKNGIIHVCPNGCGRYYKYKSGLYTHVTYECGQKKQFECNLCHQTFSRKGTLKAHTITIHKIII